MPKLPKTVYVFHYDPEDENSLTVTDDQDAAFPQNSDGPVTVGVYELRSVKVQRKEVVVLRSAPVPKGGR